MLKLCSIVIRNFTSIGNAAQSVRLDTNGMTLVLGNNTDVSNDDSANSRNGVGKSSLLNAICFALYGEPISNVKLDNLINKINQKGMLVILDFEKDGIPYRIERGRKPNVFRFFKNNKEMVEVDEALGENKNTQSEIDRLIGMDFKLFCHIVAINTDTIPFLQSKAGEQRETIELLLGITALSERDAVLVEMIKESKRLIKDEETVILATQEANNRIQNAIENAETKSKVWKDSLLATTTRIQKEIDTLSEVDFDEELKLFDEIDAFNDEFKNMSALVKAETAETETLRKSLLGFKKSKIELEKDLLNASDSQIDRLKKELVRCLSETEKTCDAEIRNIEREIARCISESEKTCDAEIERMTKQVDRYKEDIAKKNKNASDKNAEIASLRSEVENSDGHTCSTCGQGIEGTDHLASILAKLQNKIDALEKAKRKDLSDALGLEPEIYLLEAEMTKVVEDHEKSQIEWLQKASTLETQIEDIKTNYLATQKDWLDKASVIKVEIETAESALCSKKTFLEQDIADLEEKIAILADAIEEREVSEQELNDALQAMKDSAPTIKRYASREAVWASREKYNSLLQELENENSKQNPHETTIQSLKTTIKVISYENLHELQNELKHQDFIHKLLTSKESFIRKKIIDRNLHLLNSKLVGYLTALGLPHEVTFKPDLSVDINLQGRDYDFGQLSTGEKRRVILSISWSFRDVWEDLNCPMNFMFMDEAFNGLDTAASEAALGILAKMSHRKKNIFFVSHNDSLIGKVDNVLTVHKEQGFARFELG